MLFLIALIIAFIFALFCGKALKKYPYLFYLTAVLLTSAAALLPSSDTHNLPVFVNTYIFGLFSRGALATAFWCVVMIIGALPNGSALMKKLMPIRGELSIFAAILTLGHNIGYGKTYFVLLFTNIEGMSENQIYAGICTIIMLAVMLPLTVMSFPKVRKKMNARLWKKIQRSAYLFYALIYIHVMLLMIPMARSGREGYIFNIFVYSLVFFGYAFFRIRKLVLKKENIYNKKLIDSAFVFTVLMIFIVPLTAIPVKKNCEENRDKSIKTFSVSTAVSTQTSETVPAITAESETSKTVTTAAAETAVPTGETESSAEEMTSVTEAAAVETITEELVTDESEEVIDEFQQEERMTEYEQVVTPEVRQEVSVTEQQQQIVPETQQEVTVTEYQTEDPPEPQYIYNNGDFSASAFGYDGEVYITITIENDVITNISGYSNESDNWYFDSAAEQIIPAILDTQNYDVDAYSGATYSSNAIKKAVKKALDSARK